MRRFLLTVAAAASVLTVTSCSDVTGIRGPVEGTYTLQTVNGQFLPVTINDPTTGSLITIVDGQVTLDTDGTFFDELDYTDQGSSFVQQSNITGTYSRSGNTITFFPDDGTSRYTMSVSSSSRLIYSVGGNRLVYEQ
jgi:Lipocalin-like domain